MFKTTAHPLPNRVLHMQPLFQLVSVNKFKLELDNRVLILAFSSHKCQTLISLFDHNTLMIMKCCRNV